MVDYISMVVTEVIGERRRWRDSKHHTIWKISVMQGFRPRKERDSLSGEA